MAFDRATLTLYVQKYWKLWAGVGLAAGAALNDAFGFVSPGTAATIGILAAAGGISLHHKGDPIPPLPALNTFGKPLVFDVKPEEVLGKTPY